MIAWNLWSDLVSAYDGFQFRWIHGDELSKKLNFAYNRTICEVGEALFGNLKLNGCLDGQASLQQIRGFIYVTYLSSYSMNVSI